MNWHQHALLTPAEMAEADQIAVESGVRSFVLMERAGRAVADAACRMVSCPARILVLCGPGNNGGDGFVAARILAERGYIVRLSLLGARERLRGDAAEAARRWESDIGASAAGLDRYDLIVDCLFGAGLDRPLAGEAAAWVEAVNQANGLILSIDVPSGLMGADGRSDGPVIQADRTVTFFRLKPGHLLLPGRERCGTVKLAQIGIPAEAVFSRHTPRLWSNHPELWRHRWPVHGLSSHKFERGAVAVLAGGLEGVGAPRLAARAAMRIGAGLATILCRPEALPAHAARGPDALMQRAIATSDELARYFSERRLGTILAGPALGLDEIATVAVETVLGQDVPLVLDADALTVIARRPEGAVASLTGRRTATVLTPHEGEFRRLFGSQPGIADEPSKIARARAAAELTGCVIVYKGADTVIAAPDGRAVINTTGSAALATAGAGDVLGGVIAGLLAQGMPAFEAACAAVWLHGTAGGQSAVGLLADDLPELIREVAALVPQTKKARPEGRASKQIS